MDFDKAFGMGYNFFIENYEACSKMTPKEGLSHNPFPFIPHEVFHIQEEINEAFYGWQCGWNEMYYQHHGILD